MGRKVLTDKGAYLIQAFRTELGLRKEHVQGRGVGSEGREAGAVFLFTVPSRVADWTGK